MATCKRCKKFFDEIILEELNGYCPRCFKAWLHENYLVRPKAPTIMMLSTIYLVGFLIIWIFALDL